MPGMPGVCSTSGNPFCGSTHWNSKLDPPPPPTRMHKGGDASSQFLRKGAFGGVVSGRFPQKARERRCFFCSFVFVNCQWYNQYPRWGGGGGVHGRVMGNEQGTGSSCYVGKLLQLRFLVNWKTAGVLGYVIWKVFKSNSACEKTPKFARILPEFLHWQFFLGGGGGAQCPLLRPLPPVSYAYVIGDILHWKHLCKVLQFLFLRKD